MASLISVQQEANSVKIGAYWNTEKKVLQYSFSEGSRTSARVKSGHLIGSRARMILW